MVVTVEMRCTCPARHPSPKKSSVPRIATRRSIHRWPICWRESPCGLQPSRWQTRQHGSSGRLWCVARPIVPATSRHWPHNNNDTRLAEEEIGFTRLRERCDVMANRSDREQGQPTECPRHHSLRSRTGPCSWTPSWPAVSIDCVNRPDRRLHLTNATTSIYLLHRGGHPQRTFSRIYNYTS